MGKLTQSVWIADLMVLAMLAFFIVLGGVNLGEASGLAFVVIGLAVLGALYTWRQHRLLSISALSPESRRWRERRGF